jgi:hypothetical protein
MAARAKLDGKLPDSYTDVLVSRSEQDLSDVQGQFDSIQPPDDPTADKIRSDLDDLLTKGLSDLSDLRIALRRSERADMSRLTGELAKSAAKLQSFDQELAP